MAAGAILLRPSKREAAQECSCPAWESCRLNPAASSAPSDEPEGINVGQRIGFAPHQAIAVAAAPVGLPRLGDLSESRSQIGEAHRGKPRVDRRDEGACDDGRNTDWAGAG